VRVHIKDARQLNAYLHGRGSPDVPEYDFEERRESNDIVGWPICRQGSAKRSVPL